VRAIFFGGHMPNNIIEDLKVSIQQLMDDDNTSVDKETLSIMLKYLELSKIKKRSRKNVRL
jgi:predicted DNA-binding ArsR family transcriptional regulator